MSDIPDLATLGLRVDSGQVEEADQAINRLGKTGEAVEEKLKHFFAAAAAAFGLHALIHKFAEETILSQSVQAQLEAGIRSTGGAAGFTAQQLSHQAEELQKVTVYSDEAVKSAESVLLTFDRIRGDNFERTTRAVADLASRMGGDLSSSAFQLGKALNDPVSSLTLLRRAGIQFTAEQKELIKTLAESGKLAEAQGHILDVVERKFRGSAAAARDTLGGALAGLKNDFGDLFEATKQESSALVDFINVVDRGVSTVKRYRDIMLAVVEAVGLLTAATVVLALSGATTITWITGLIGRMAAAAAGMEVLSAATLGFGKTLGTAIALTPLAVLAAGFAVLTVAIRNARLEAQLAREEIAGAEQDANALAFLTAKRNVGTKRAQEMFPTFLPPRPAGLGNEASEQEIQRQKAAKKFIESLKQEADLLGLSAEQARRYKVEHQELNDAGAKLTATERALALAQVVRIEAKQRLLDELAREKEMQDRMGQLDTEELARNAQIVQSNLDRETSENAVHAAVFDQVQGLQLEAENLDRQAAASRQGKQARDQLRVAMAGEAAVREAINRAISQSVSLTEEEIRAIRRAAEVRERSSIGAADATAIAESWQNVSQSVANVVTLLANADSASAKFLGTIVTAVGQIEAAIKEAEATRKLSLTSTVGLIATGLSLVIGGGESEAERRSRETMEKNNARLEELRRSVDSLALGITGTQFSTALAGTQALLGAGGLNKGGFPGVDLDRAKVGAILAAQHTSLAELLKIAEDLGFALDTSSALAFTNSLKTLNEALQKMALVTLKTFAGQLDLLNRKWALGGVTDPLKKLADLLALIKTEAPRLAGGGILGPGLGSFDLGTGGGRTQALDFLLKQLERARSGQLTTAELGNLTLQQYLDFLSNFGGLLNEANQALQSTVDSLRAFSDSLKLDQSLTTLSPAQQLAEARHQYETVLGQAQMGDLAAANRLPDVARQFLQASRAYNASSPAYAADFARVLRETDALAGMLNTQWELVNKTANATMETADNTEGMLVEMKTQITVLKDTATTQQEGFIAIENRLVNLTAVIEENARMTKLALEGLSVN